MGVLLNMIIFLLSADVGASISGALLGEGKDLVRIVLMTGFESFNVALYKKVCRRHQSPSS